jgi:xanthine dehydrogenase YagT iron-sulfur-binding subunit
MEKSMSDHEKKPDACPDQVQVAFTRISRRSFLTRISAAGAAVGVGQLSLDTQAATPAPDELAAPSDAASDQATMQVRLRVNGIEHQLVLDPRTTLLDCVREHLHLPGTKKGCDHGQCGACTVHVNDRRINSCLSLAATHEGDAITTIEGLGQPGRLHPMQQAFVEHDGYQCGYCTAGQIMSATALLHEPCGAADGDVKEAMSGNICRCGAYANIVSAIQQVRRKA